MYVTRPLSLYKNSPEALADPPPKGPNSGYLVLQDDESTPTTCFGLCKNTLTTDLPFPQNKSFTIQHQLNETTTNYSLFLIPVINQPLSSNHYYAIKEQGKHKGEAYTSSTEEDRQISCFCLSYIKDQKTRELDPNDKSQQFEFSHSTTCGGNTIFRVESVAADGYPPMFMRNGGWSLWNSEPKHFTLVDADGTNSLLRARLPDFNKLSASEECSKVVVVGKWYTPFMFVKEGTPKEQTKRSMFYEVTLEQRWERIFYCENDGSKGTVVSFDILYPTEKIAVNGEEAKETSKERVGGMMLFRAKDYNGVESKIGLTLLIVERMIWEQERVGWSDNKEKRVKLTGVEKYRGVGSWTKFGCYLLVESFVFKRMDGSIALSFDFNHTHKVKIKWDSTATYLC